MKKISLSLSLLAFLGFFALHAVCSPSYDEEIAKESWIYCLASYCPQNLIVQWKAGKMSQINPDLKDIRTVYNAEDNTLGFLAYNPKSNIIYVVFRGTEPTSISNWLNNLKFFKIKYSYCSDCEVHLGFYESFLRVKDDVLKNLNELRKSYPTAKVRVTGHSLGGALALFAALEIEKNVCDVDVLYTFGQPRVGDEKFAKYVNEEFKGKFNARVTNGRDPVPRVPLQTMGYIHQDSEVFYDNGKFRECSSGEDDKCSKKFFLPLNINAHFLYMGYSYITYTQNKCAL